MALLALLVWVVAALIVFLSLRAFFKFRKNAEFFRKNGVPYIGAGLYRTFQFFTGQTNLVKVQTEIYNDARKTNAPVVGVTDVFGGPSLYIMDLDILRNIYVKDFESFVDRRPVETTKTNVYFKKFLFSMEGEQWKGIRSKLSPSFTTGRIRKMFEIFAKSSARMDSYIKGQIPSGSGDLDLATLFPKYAMDVIASCAFGIDSKCWDVAPGQMSVFEKMGNRFQFNFTGLNLLKMILFVASPKLADFLGIDAMDYKSGLYFSSVIKDVMKRRRETGERQDDFLQLMMDAQQGILKADEETRQVMNGSLEGEQQGGIMESGAKVTFDDEDIVANGMLFLLGGFDPTQSVLLFVMYCLALHPEVQQKLFQEVESAKEKNGGELTYQAVLEMTYMELVINETMRLYTPSAATERRCTKEYKVPGMDLVIPKGHIVAIAIHPIHLDERYFPNPEKFIPERFLPEEKAKRHPYAHAPFGHGPRNCIGMRFALVKVKAVIAQLVSSYQFAPCSQTKIPVEFGSSANIKPLGGMWLNLTARN